MTRTDMGDGYGCVSSNLLCDRDDEYMDDDEQPETEMMSMKRVRVREGSECVSA